MEKLKKATTKSTKAKTTNKVTEDVMEKVEEKIEKKKTKRQINMELKKNQDEIYVQICNMSFMSVVYTNKNEEVYFDLLPNVYTDISLAELWEVANKCKFFFKDYMIIVTDVLSDEYTIDNVVDYVGISSIYNSEESQLTAKAEELLNLPDDRFERKIQNRKESFLRNLACKAIMMTKSEENDFELSRRKEKILCDLLGREQLLDID